MDYEDYKGEDFLFAGLSEECRDEIAELRATFAALAHSVTPVAPPVHLRAQIIENIKTRAASSTQTVKADKDTTRPRLSNATSPSSVVIGQGTWRLGLVAASIVLLALLASLFWLLGLSSQRDSLRAERDRAHVELAREREVSDLLTQAESRIVALNGTGVAPRAEGRLAYDRRTGRAALFVHNLPSPPAGRVYQLWFITPGDRKIPGATFSTDAEGNAVVRSDAPAEERANAAAFAITLEPQTGSTSPTGEIYLASSAS